MAFTGDWLRGARRISDVRHLLIKDLVEEFDAVRTWLLILRNSVVDEMQVAETVRGKNLLWTLLKEIDENWCEVTKLYLSCDRSPDVRHALIKIVNSVTIATTRNRQSRLLPSPVFLEGKLITPVVPTKPGIFRRLFSNVRSRLGSDTPRRKWKTTNVTSLSEKSLLSRIVDSFRNASKRGSKVLPA